jgi:cation:H+ antiporter
MDLTTLLLFVAGLVLLVAGAEFFVRGAARLAALIGVSPLVIGLTVVALGTSSPEIAVSLQAAFAGQPDLAIGNVVGSNICNILLILGLAAVVAPLVVAQQLVRFDVPIMIGLSVVTLLLALDGRLSRLDGTLLLVGGIGYVAFLLVQGRKEGKAVQEEYEREFGVRPASGGKAWLLHGGLIALGFIMLLVGSRWLVTGAVSLAQALGISELVIGLTVVAIGTSLPEVATSVVASLRGERDIAVGNAVGSNIFNIFAVLGLASIFGPEGISVSATALRFDIPVMIAVAVACLPIFFTGHLIARWEGFLFLGYFVAYLLFLFLQSTAHQALPLFSSVMLLFVMPLTVVTLLTVSVRALRAGRSGNLDETP